MSCAKMAEPIALLFGLWTWVGPRKHKFNRIHQVGHVGATVPSYCALMRGTLVQPSEYD